MYNWMQVSYQNVILPQASHQLGTNQAKLNYKEDKSGIYLGP